MNTDSQIPASAEGHSPAQLQAMENAREQMQAVTRMVPVSLGRPTPAPEVAVVALNVASQCRATASHPLTGNVTVDGGAGLLAELLTDAAQSIEALLENRLEARLAELMRKCREEKHDLTYADLQALANAPAPSSVDPVEMVTLIGVKADGSETILGEIPQPPIFKARDIVRSYFNSDLDDEDSDAAMALQCCRELIAHMNATPPANAQQLRDIIAAVPDIGDKAAREWAIARMASRLADHPPVPGRAPQVELNADEAQALMDLLGPDHGGTDFEAECPSCTAFRKLAGGCRLVTGALPADLCASLMAASNNILTGTAGLNDSKACATAADLLAATPPSAAPAEPTHGWQEPARELLRLLALRQHGVHSYEIDIARAADVLKRQLPKVPSKLPGALPPPGEVQVDAAREPDSDYQKRNEDLWHLGRSAGK